MDGKEKRVNNLDIPQYAIETVARCLLPDIIAYFKSEEGRREFAKWKQRQEEDNTDTNGDMIACIYRLCRQI